MEKSAEAFRTISEVSDLLDTPAHVLRFWESRFAQVKPLKRAGGRRYYRPSDVALLGGIRKLLHDDGMTIRGVQKILREHGVRHVATLSSVEGAPAGAAPESRARSGNGATAKVDGAPWPATASPEAADRTDRLVQDPDDAAAVATDEAPMELDAPTLPLGLPGNVLPLQSTVVGTTAPSPPTDAVRPPAAAMLRAMDALRARDKKGELRVVYSRLTTLRDRLARRNGPASN